MYASLLVNKAPPFPWIFALKLYFFLCEYMGKSVEILFQKHPLFVGIHGPCLEPKNILFLRFSLLMRTSIRYTFDQQNTPPFQWFFALILYFFSCENTEKSMEILFQEHPLFVGIHGPCLEPKNILFLSFSMQMRTSIRYTFGLCCQGRDFGTFL